MHESDAGWTGWVGYGSGAGGKDHLPPDVRAAVERREKERNQRRGRLLCEVHVQVFEHEVEGEPSMYVTFPAGSVLDPDGDPAEVAAAVARAREMLGRWR
jgi:hypothetical protein